MPPRPQAADLTLRETAAALGLSVGTVRQHVKAGRLAASQAVGKYGPEYRLRPAVVVAFAADRYGLELDAADMSKGPAGVGMDDATRELYERLLRATEEATRYKALSAAEGEHYGEEIARERAARIAAETQLAAELARPWWRRRKPAE